MQDRLCFCWLGTNVFFFTQEFFMPVVSHGLWLIGIILLLIGKQELNILRYMLWNVLNILFTSVSWRTLSQFSQLNMFRKFVEDGSSIILDYVGWCLLEGQITSYSTIIWASWSDRPLMRGFVENRNLIISMKILSMVVLELSRFLVEKLTVLCKF